jgi:hypothetical protein
MKAFSRLLIAAIGAAAFASCTQNGGLIYMNIQKTTKTNTSTSIPLDITVSDMVVTGGGGGAAPYYVAAGKIYSGTVPSTGSTSWSAISVPQSSGKDMLCNALAWDGTYLWGGFFSSDGSTVGLYYMAPSSGTWTLVTAAQIAGKQITYVGWVNSLLFVAAATISNGSFVYELDVLSGGPAGTWTPTTLAGAATLSKPITGVGFAGTTYYATSWNIIYTATGIPPFAFGASYTSSNSNDLFRGVYVDTDYLGTPGNNLIIVPSSNQTAQTSGIGGVFYSTTGAGGFTEATTNAGTSYTVGFLCAAGPVDSGHSVYLLGSDCGFGGAFGFFSFTPSTVSLNRFSGLSYSLYASAVNRVFVDAANSIVAMGTINNGLWVTYPVDTTGGFGSNTWTQE